MTQPELIKKYIEEFGSIIPAKCIGKNYGGGFFGAELSRVCRKMRWSEKNPTGILVSQPEGKFEKFTLRIKREIIIHPDKVEIVEYRAKVENKYSEQNQLF